MVKLLQHIEIKSNQESLDSILSIFDEMIEQVSISEEDVPKIKLCVVEAVTNAIVHGNKMNEEKLVKISLISKRNHFVFKIQDEGKGFPIDKIQSPLTEENKLKCHGRGLFIMKHLSKKINFCNKSNILELQFEYHS